MAVLMNLNHNGQAITLSNQLKEKGATDGAKLKALVDKGEAGVHLCTDVPTGTHAMWIYYWLAANGIHPFNDVKTIVVPPPQMVANMRVGNMDGFCVGEPWNNRAIYDRIGFTAETTQAVWKDHPEKTLGTTLEFVQKNPNTARAMTAAVLDASKYIDVMANRKKVSEIIADKSYVNCPVEVIDQRLEGSYDNGIGKQWKDPDYMKFYDEGYVNFPFLSDGMWFMTQHRRWGLLKEDPDYLAVAKKVNQIDIYKQAAAATKTPLPKDVMRTSKLIDGVAWDGKDPKAYAASFKLKSVERDHVRNARRRRAAAELTNPPVLTSRPPTPRRRAKRKRASRPIGPPRISPPSCAGSACARRCSPSCLRSSAWRCSSRSGAWYP
jgi:nitrate/nitrite transport system substrate-binding protein